MISMASRMPRRALSGSAPQIAAKLSRTSYSLCRRPLDGLAEGLRAGSSISWQLGQCARLASPSDLASTYSASYDPATFRPGAIWDAGRVQRVRTRHDPRSRDGWVGSREGGGKRLEGQGDALQDQSDTGGARRGTRCAGDGAAAESKPR